MDSIWSTEGADPPIVDKTAPATVVVAGNGIPDGGDTTVKADPTPGAKKRFSTKARKEIKKLERKQRNVQRKKGGSNTLKPRSELEGKTDVIVADFKYLTI